MRSVYFPLFFSFLFCFPSFCAFDCTLVDLYRNVDQFRQLAIENHVDFDVSMQAADYPDILEKKVSGTLFNVFQWLYLKNNLRRLVPSQNLKIPKILHYIWFGRKLPQKYLPFLQSWLDLHPDWTFLIWVDNPENYDLGTVIENANFETVEKLIADHEGIGGHFVVDVKNLTFDNCVFFDKAKNYGERSDILRWEVVYRFGGTYVDTDFECFKPFDLLHHTCDFFTGIQPLDTKIVQLGSGLVGAVPFHPILKQCVDTIEENNKHTHIVFKTGPIHFTKALISVIGKTGFTDIVFPASYFYPCNYQQAGRPYDEWIKPESFATHHWEGSWLKDEAWDRD